MDKDKALTFVFKALNQAKKLYAGFSLRWKIFLLIAVLLGVAVLVIAPRESTIVREDKISFVKDLTGRLTRSTAKSFLNRINALQDKLIIFTSYRESLSHTTAKMEDQLTVLFAQEQEFLSIGLLAIDERGTITPAWELRNPQNEQVRAWPQEQERLIYSQLTVPSGANGGSTNGRAIWKVHGPNGTNLLVFGLRVEIADPKPVAPQATPLRAPAPVKTWIAGILPTTAFDDLFTDFSTGLNRAYLLDEEGVAVASSDPAAKWKSLKGEPLFNEALQKSKTGASNEYVLDGHKVIGGSAPVTKTNLVTVVVTPEDNIFDVTETISRSVHFIGLIFLLFALALTILFSNYFLDGPLRKLRGIVSQWGEGRFTLPPDSTGAMGDELNHLAAGFSAAAQSLSNREEKFQTEQRELTLKEK